MDDLNEFCRLKNPSLPEGWRWHGLDCRKGVVPDGYTKVVGAVPSSFKKNGRPVWGKLSKETEQTMFIVWNEYLQWSKNRDPQHEPASGREGE